MIADIQVLIQAAGQWLVQNQAWLGALRAALGIAGVAFVIAKWGWKPFRFIWSRIKRRAKPLSKPEAASFVADLAFIPLPNESRCAVDSERGLTQVNTHWYVTNQSARSLVVLTASLLMPDVSNQNTYCQVRTSRNQGLSYVMAKDDDLLPRATRKLAIHCFVQQKLQEPGEVLELIFAVTDQFAKQHRMPKIALTTIDMTAKK